MSDDADMFRRVSSALRRQRDDVADQHRGHPADDATLRELDDLIAWCDHRAECADKMADAIETVLATATVHYDPDALRQCEQALQTYREGANDGQ